MPAEEHEDEDEDHKALLSPGTFLRFAAASWRAALTRLGPMAVPFVIANLLIGGVSTAIFVAREDQLTGAQVLAIVAVGYLLLTAVGGYFAACCAEMIVNHLQGQQVTVREGMAVIRPMRGHIIAASLYAGALVIMLRYALGPIGYFLSLPLGLGPPIMLHAISLERRTLSDGWQRTKTLMRGNAFRLFVYLLTLSLGIALFVGLLLTLLAAGVIAMDASEATRALIEGLGGSLLNGFAGVFLASALLIAYFDARSRTEEFDLDDLETVYESDAVDTEDDE